MHVLPPSFCIVSLWRDYKARPTLWKRERERERQGGREGGREVGREKKRERERERVGCLLKL